MCIRDRLVSLAAVAAGLTTVREEIFENRFTHKKELAKMGADIEICGKNAIIKGIRQLQGCEVAAQDLRCLLYTSYFPDKNEFLTHLPGLLAAGDVVLVKASRGMALEEIADRMLAAQEATDSEADR